MPVIPPDVRTQMLNALRQIDDLRQTIQLLLASDSDAGLTDVAQKMARDMGHPWDQIAGPRRTRVLVDARTRIAQALRDQGASLTQIGRILNRDHTSILNLIRRSRAAT